MKNSFSIEGMTCQSCVASVTERLLNVDGVETVQVDLEKGEAEIEMKEDISISAFKNVLPEKYNIEQKVKGKIDDKLPFDRLMVTQKNEKVIGEKTKLQQLKPLLLIFAYLFAASFLLNYNNWSTREAMLDFMGLFYIVFSFFKFLDLKGFPESFKMYDPLAKLIPIYGWIYPFIELTLGIMFLMRFQIPIALAVTIVVLGMTTIGVTKTLLDKKQIRCACLGTALQLPMTEATFIENTIMLVMAIIMLVKIF
ncbi:heavy-metal-associated domain-containing protein [Croceitalea rosinachiae]|uniref:Heavy metal-associated domain-containing protein n=1 Tax=Croceitalea rosinachiae TaxID=3075596 RepID=A0ABU3A9B3_9FLAO|nr:heavy metal-associated domain-containing protein [Croceitalea sp. F388]MDT0606771.1 heavy metal-associated domain-containing protein [Croceitalea sp. F388]